MNYKRLHSCKKYTTLVEETENPDLRFAIFFLEQASL